MSDLADVQTWLGAHRGELYGLLASAADLAEALRPAAQRYGVPLAAWLKIEDAVVVRQLADAAGLSEIAGKRGVSADDVLGALGYLVRIGSFLVSVAI